MKKLLFLLLFPLAVFSQDSVKLDSRFAFKLVDGYKSVPIYIDVINKQDSIIQYTEQENDMLLNLSDSCNTALNAAKELNHVMLKDTVKSKHDAKWKVVWRKCTIYFVGLLTIENVGVYLLYRKP